MTDQTWVVFDVHFLFYRAFYSAGMVTSLEDPTAVVTRLVLNHVRSLNDLYNAEGRLAFCFDSVGEGLRVKIDPLYKLKRREKKLKEPQTDLQKRLGLLDGVIRNFESSVLPALGLANSFRSEGYEADDLVARVVQSRQEDPFIISSGDKDLYQLLSPRVGMRNPTSNQYVSDVSFVDRYGIVPGKWTWVKALAGCDTDGVVGLPGVGEILACQYYMNVRHRMAEACDLFVAGDRFRLNQKLVTLALPGCPKVHLKDPGSFPSEYVWRGTISKLKPGKPGGFGLRAHREE